MNTDIQFASLHIRRGIHAEGIIAISPVAGILSVDGDSRLCHGTVKHQFGSLIAFGNLHTTAIPSLTYPGQCSAAATLLGGFCLAILRNGHALQVPLLVERTGNGPVMWHLYLVPYLIVPGEFPRRQMDFTSCLRYE